MNFGKCNKCKLMLPQYRLYPMLVTKQGKQFKVYLCERCKGEVEKNFKRKNNVK